jgi:hypothetical protein
MWRQNTSRRVKGGIGTIGLKSFFPKTLIITPKKRTVLPEDAFEDTDLSKGLKL